MATCTNNNGSVFEKDEVRYGAPLDYVGEKLENAVLYAVTHCKDLQAASREGWKNEQFESYSKLTVGYAAQSFVLLYNQGALYKGEETVDMLLDMSSAELSNWLDEVVGAGSVTGSKE